jgi:hypothetical protein
MKIKRFCFPGLRNAPLPRLDRHLLLTVLGCALCWVSPSRADDWQSTLTKNPPGDFPPPRPLRAKYTFGWSGFTAATGEVYFSKSPDNRFQLNATGGTLGLPRFLWRMDTTYFAATEADSLRPIEVKQNEAYRSKKIATHLTFEGNSVKSERLDANKAETRDFSFPRLFDLWSATLYLRSQPLKERSVYRTVVYPAKNAYLVTITVMGREKIAVRAGSFNAIKLDVKLQRVGKDLQLEPYRKLRRASLWVSDDDDRMVLRIEAQIFVGTIFAELQSVRYETPKT